MRKSSHAVRLGALTALSTIVLAACEIEEPVEEVTADCVDTSSRADDGSYRVVDDRFCDGGSHVGFVHVYGGNVTSGRVRGGSLTKPADAHISTRSGRVIQRGGFGGKVGGGGG